MSVGAELRKVREARKLSLGDVTAATKIQPWVLEAIEADKLIEQMSPVYARGFIASYGRFLGLPMDNLLSQLTPQSPIVEKAEALPAAAAVPTEAIPQVVKVRLDIPWAAIGRSLRRLAPVAAVVAVILINPFRWLPKISLPTAQQARAASAKKTDAKKATAAKPQQKSLKLASVVPVKGAATVVVPKPAQPAAQPAAPQPAPLELSITANRATWVKVRADGKLLTQQRLERGAKERWVAKKSLDIVVAKPSQVELSLNGQPINAAAIQNNGRLAITHQGINLLGEEI